MASAEVGEAAVKTVPSILAVLVLGLSGCRALSFVVGPASTPTATATTAYRPTFRPVTTPTLFVSGFPTPAAVSHFLYSEPDTERTLEMRSRDWQFESRNIPCPAPRCRYATPSSDVQVILYADADGMLDRWDLSTELAPSYGQQLGFDLVMLLFDSVGKDPASAVMAWLSGVAGPALQQPTSTDDTTEIGGLYFELRTDKLVGQATLTAERPP